MDGRWHIGDPAAEANQMDIVRVKTMVSSYYPVVKVARSSRGAHGTKASMGVGILAYFMHKMCYFEHKIALFH